MDKQTYKQLMEYFGSHRGLCKFLIATEKTLEILTVIVYVGMLIFCLYEDIGFALRSAVTSLIALYLCTLIRFVKNSPRPYEKYGILPAMNKDTRGQSFPSRHLTSAAVITVSLLRVLPPLGVGFLLITALMGTLRVLLGVHFIKDVAVGAVIGILIGLLGVYAFPLLF